MKITQHANVEIMLNSNYSSNKIQSLSHYLILKFKMLKTQLYFKEI